VQEAGADFDPHELLVELERDMASAAANLEYERAALLRDQIMELKAGTGVTKLEPRTKPAAYGRGRRRGGARA